MNKKYNTKILKSMIVIEEILKFSKLSDVIVEIDPNKLCNLTPFVIII